jgi:predicted nucleic acid-binding protein
VNSQDSISLQIKNPVIVDTSVFVDYLRGNANDALTVITLNNQVLLSAVVRLELLTGVRKTELKALTTLFNGLRQIDSFAPPADCTRLLIRARGTGFLGGVPDLLILADVARFKGLLFTHDQGMKLLAKKLGLRLLNT